MPTSCQDVTAKMMELLYGELPEGERASIDGHVAECGKCRAELEGFQRARAVARQVLDDAPPARAREAILRAAAAAAAEVRAQPRSALAAARAAEVAPARAAEDQPRPRAEAPKPGPERSSFWGWLRGRWTLPTLATVGAVAVFVLGSRLFLDPVKPYERGRAALAPSPAAEPPAPTSPPHPSSPVAAAAAQTAGIAEGASLDEARAALSRAKAEDVAAPADEKSEPTDKAAPRGSGAKHRRAEPSRGEEKREALKDSERDGLSGLLGRPGGGAAFGVGGLGVGSGVAGAATRSDSFTRPPTARPKPEKKTAAPKAEIQMDALDAPPSRFAPPPPPRAASAPAPAATAERERYKAKAPAKGSIDDLLLDGVADRSKAKPSPPAEQASTSAPDTGAGRRSAAAAPAPAAAPPQEAVANSVEPNASARSKGGKSFAATPAETLRQRADRLFADGRWAEAAAAYRELLRNDPDSPDAEHWRQRLAVAVQAEGEAPARATAKAAKAAKRPAAADKQATH